MGIAYQPNWRVTVTLDDWTKLLDVALANTQRTCVTLTEVPDSPDELLGLIALARSKADAGGMTLSRLELPADRFQDAADFSGAVGVATDVVRLSFSAAAPVTTGRRIVVLGRVAAQPVKQPARIARSRNRRNMNQHRGPSAVSMTPSDVRQT